VLLWFKQYVKCTFMCSCNSTCFTVGTGLDADLSGRGSSLSAPLKSKQDECFQVMEVFLWTTIPTQWNFEGGAGFSAVVVLCTLKEGERHITISLAIDSMVQRTIWGAKNSRTDSAEVLTVLCFNPCNYLHSTFNYLCYCHPNSTLHHAIN